MPGRLRAGKLVSGGLTRDESELNLLGVRMRGGASHLGQTGARSRSADMLGVYVDRGQGRRNRDGEIRVTKTNDPQVVGYVDASAPAFDHRTAGWHVVDEH